MANDKDEYGRDIEIKRIFENADDSIMGVLGNLLFIIIANCKNV